MITLLVISYLLVGSLWAAYALTKQKALDDSLILMVLCAICNLIGWPIAIVVAICNKEIVIGINKR